MFNDKNLKILLQQLNFEEEDNNIYTVHINNTSISVNFTTKQIIYPQTLKPERETICNFSKNENFVVLECIVRLLNKGYSAENIYIEKGAVGGHGLATPWLDILITDKNEEAYLLIECKTPCKEYDDAWEQMLLDGGQLFNYFNSFQKAKFLCLYTSDFENETSNQVIYKNKIVSLIDNEDYLKNNNLKGYNSLTRATKTDYFNIWEKIYSKISDDYGIFEKGIKAYEIGKKKVTVDNLNIITDVDIQKKYNKFASILRKYNISGRENAFDKLVNLFLVKIVDETTHPDALQFYWNGSAYDDFYSLQDRLQKMYKDGMQEFLNEKVTYIDQKAIHEAFHLFKNDPDSTKEKILEYFKKLKFYTNNDFSFLDVHNENLFNQNSNVLKDIVSMLQDIKLRTNEQNQFLGDLFEGFLDQGIKQSEGQFFTPMPIVRFIVSSLPLKQLISNDNIPAVLDYACGAGHFLNEYAMQVQNIIKQDNLKKDVNDYYSAITGIEKEYRLSKVAKVAAFMYNENNIRILYGDALSNSLNVKDEKFSVIIANPPYSVKGFLETLSEEDRKSYRLYEEDINIQKNSNIELFFVERAEQLLCEGGIAAIILPSTILTNKSSVHVKCREIILKKFDIIAISMFGSATFGKTGTKTITLFLRKKRQNPKIDEHYLNRVDSWFSSSENKEKDSVFEDITKIQEYCKYMDYDYDAYKEFMMGTINEELYNNEMFLSYHRAFNGETNDKLEGLPKAKECKKQYKDVIKTRDYKNSSIENKQKVDLMYFSEFCRKIEKEKLYYYILASINPPVVISQTPSKKSDMKKFLGYEWSEMRGHEGIKYLNISNSNDTDTDEYIQQTINRLKGIKDINTPLFNPSDYEDKTKINTVIRDNFNNREIEIDKELLQYVKVMNVEDMMDFSMNNFDKAINIMNVKVTVECPYKQSKIGSCIDDLGGQWESAKEPTINVPVIKSTNFNKAGTLDNNTDIERINANINSYNKRKINAGDILIEKSGGSETQAVGRVVYFENSEEYTYQTFLAKIKVKDSIKDSIYPKFLYHYLNYIYQLGITKYFQTSSNGLMNLSFPRYKTIPIPIPDDKIQLSIISDCDKLIEKYSTIHMTLSDLGKYYNDIFKRNHIKILIDDNLSDDAD